MKKLGRCANYWVPELVEGPGDIQFENAVHAKNAKDDERKGAKKR